MKFLSTLFSFILFGLCLIFALNNKDSVSVSLWPMDAKVTAPLFVMTLGALGLGIFLGGGFVWLGHLPHRFMARRLGKDVVKLSGRVLELEQELTVRRAADAAKNPPEPPMLAPLKWKFWEKL